MRSLGQELELRKGFVIQDLDLGSVFCKDWMLVFLWTDFELVFRVWMLIGFSVGSDFCWFSGFGC